MRLTRQFPGQWGTRYGVLTMQARGPRPARGGAVAVVPFDRLAVPGYNGMDPSDPATYVRPWQPQPGMIAYLNFDGAALQGRTDTGGVSRKPARSRTRAAARPARRPR